MTIIEATQMSTERVRISSRFLRTVEDRAGAMADSIMTGDVPPEILTKVSDLITQARAFIDDGRQDHALVCLAQAEAALAG
jgi:hypothetical protein